MGKPEQAKGELLAAVLLWPALTWAGWDADFRELKALAEQGHVNGQSILGLMYEMGRGVAQNYGDAVK